MLHTAGLTLTWIAALGIIGIGIGYLSRSAANAAGFGLPVMPAVDARGWWQVKGVRDVTSGILTIVAIFAAPQMLAGLLVILAITPLGDASVVLANRGRKSAAFGIHGATAVGLLLAALLLALS